MSSPERAPAVRCDGLTRRYGERVALDAVSLTVAPGQRLLLTGGNGAGKTTLLRVLATVLRPHAGEVAIDGHVLPRDARKVRPAIGYVGHEPLVYPVLTARENLELYAALYGVGRERIDQVLDLAGLDGRGGDPAGELSRGPAPAAGPGAGDAALTLAAAAGRAHHRARRRRS